MENIRSAVSSLYYSIHKFITSESYNFAYSNFNKKDVSDFEIELGHFTSNIYAKDFIEKMVQDPDKIIIQDINEKNYQEKLKTNRGNLNPFIFSYLIFQEKDLQDTHLIFQDYIKHIYSVITGKTMNKQEKTQVIKKLNDLIKKRNNSEENIIAAIALSIKYFLKSHKNKDIWAFFALMLRLYWLRQTADYDYDFEVRTSLREISVITTTIKTVIETLNLETQLKQKYKDINEKDNKAIDKENIESGEGEHKDPLLIDNKNIETDFLVDFHHDDIIYLTAVHIDMHFNFNNIIQSLNLKENVFNRGKYFELVTGNYFDSIIYLHINKEGKWTIWMNSKNSISKGDLELLANDFLNDFFGNNNKDRGNNLEGRNVLYEIILSKPSIYKGEMTTLNLSSMLELQNSMNNRHKQLEKKVVNRLATHFDFDLEGNMLLISNRLGIVINLLFEPQSLKQLLPSLEIAFHRNNRNKIKVAVINLIVSRKRNKQLFVIDLFYERLFKDMSLLDFRNYEIDLENLDSFLRYRNDQIIDLAIDTFNNLAVNAIENNDFDTAYDLIEYDISREHHDEISVATLGLWHLRNNELKSEDADAYGVKYYKESIKEATKNNREYLSPLKQKYYYEVAKFYVNNKKLEKAKHKLEKALTFGEIEKYESHYDEIMLLKEEMDSAYEIQTEYE